MAAVTAQKDWTVFPNGTDSRLAIAKGAAAGDVAVDSSFGIAAGTILEQVSYVVLATNAVVTTAKDLSSEFTSPVATDNTINNTGGTSTAGGIVFIKFRNKSLNTLQY